MPTPRWRAWDVDPGLMEALSGVTAIVGQLRDALYGMTGPGDGCRGRSWGKGFVWSKTFGPWGGGSGPWGGGSGPWNAWWPGPPGSPRGQRGGKAARGDVRAAILALLQEAPRTGYQIMSDIEERSGGAWRPSPGAVYPALAQLADEGLIVGDESGGRRTYRLTDAGRDYLEQNPGMARGAWESRSQQEAWQPPGLFAEAARLAGGIVQVAQAGTPEQVRAAERLLEQTRRKLYQILADENDSAEPDEPDGGDHGDE
jgi:DNA-binding PadR family transcriptional regulator